MNKNIIAGIVLFNPNLPRLVENIAAIIPQVDRVIIVNNGSQNYEKIKNYCNKWHDIIWIENSINRGIAAALNQIMQYAHDNNYEWVLALDQDSVCRQNLVKTYMEYLDNDTIGMLTCHIEDRNFQFEEAKTIPSKLEYIDFCITSGSLLRTKAWLDVGGYDEEMFIDKVDTDMCWLLDEHHWKIGRVPYTGILHEIGNSTKRIKVFNRDVVIFNHSAFRCYYIVRNGIYCAAKHSRYRNTKGMRKSSFHRILLCLIFEKGKLKKLHAGIKGIIDGYKMIKEKRIE